MSSRNTADSIRNPATGAELAKKITHGREDAIAAAERARVAQPAWAALSIRERGSVFRAMKRYIVQHAHDLAAIVSECTGKPRIDALSTEVLPGVIMCDYYTRHAGRFLSPRRLRGGSLLFFNKASRLYREPYGLVGIISPWNYPLGIPLHEVITGLLCGNAVLLKVATQAQPVGDAIARMLADCGLPAGVFHLLHLPGAVAGDALLDSGIGKLFFTGSTEVGRELAAKAGERLIPISLELGGNDAMIVSADAKVERAAWGAAWAGLSNAGQSCAGVERIYVADAVYDRFVEHLRRIVQNLRVGPDTDFRVDVGSLTTSGQLDTVRSHLEDALESGARETALTSSPDGDGLFHPAVVLEDAPDDAATMRHETFGPLLSVKRVPSDGEAVRLANDSYLGLSASVWSCDRRRARRLAEGLQVGAVTINDHLMSHGMAETPWGGYKQSGIGRSHGEFGFHEMTQPKVVVDERFPWMKKNMWWHPYSEEVYDGLFAAMVAGYGRGLFRRLAAAAKMSALFVSRALGRN